MIVEGENGKKSEWLDGVNKERREIVVRNAAQESI